MIVLQFEDDFLENMDDFVTLDELQEDEEEDEEEEEDTTGTKCTITSFIVIILYIFTVESTC